MMPVFVFHRVGMPLMLHRSLTATIANKVFRPYANVGAAPRAYKHKRVLARRSLKNTHICYHTQVAGKLFVSRDISVIVLSRV